MIAAEIQAKVIGDMMKNIPGKGTERK